MQNGYFYPNSHIKKQVELIKEGVIYKRKYEKAIGELNYSDSLIQSQINTNSKNNLIILRLKADSLISHERFKMYDNFQKDIVIPTMKEIMKEQSKVYRKNGILIGGGVASICFLLLSIFIK